MKERPFVARWRDAVLSADGPPKPMTRLVLLALAKYMNGSGENCWPSVDTLAVDTGSSRRTVCTHLSLAQSLSWITVITKTGAGRAWRLHQYRPAIPIEGGERISQPLPKGGEGGSQPSGKGGENDAPKVGKVMHEGGERFSHEQEREQEREQEGAAQGGQRRSRATQLPKSFEPDETCRSLASELGVDLDAELPKFRDHYAANEKPFKNWQATFRNWLRKAREFDRTRPPAGRESQRRVSPSDHVMTSYD